VDLLGGCELARETWWFTQIVDLAAYATNWILLPQGTVVTFLAPLASNFEGLKDR
jgi:hypothetical protein